MNNLVVAPPLGEPVMTSRQIAEYLDIRHDSVERAIERLAERSLIVRPPLVDERQRLHGKLDYSHAATPPRKALRAASHSAVLVLNIM